MRVLQFRTLCDSGGVSSSMLLLGRQLAERGIDCEYWFCRSSNRLSEFEALAPTTLAPMPKLVERLAVGDIDFVQMTASDPGAELVGRLARDKARVIVTARGALSDHWTRDNCFAYTAISQGMAEVNQPYTDLQIEVIRNSIDLSRFNVLPRSVGSESPVLAFVGRTKSNEKDFPRFTRIASLLVARGMRVWIADPHEGSWQNFEGTGATRVEPERWGPVSHASMPDFYRDVAASNGVVLMTSLTEGFGNVAPEAAACGARVAAPDVMGLREAIVDRVTGRLFPADADDATVAAMLHDWIQQPHDSDAVAAATRREFSPTVMMDAYAAIYERQTPRLWPADVRPAPRVTREMPLLLEHLKKQRTWRAEFEWKAAMDLGNAGLGQETRQAMTMALRTAPAQFANARSARQFVRMSRAIMGSYVRRSRSSRAARG
ncbi:MAG: glycosyltransferase family 4 protein [Phycisphaerae bacterium]|nr:glycosyltransferase family 4 protein [Gemmatimonadaceae bacterium]